MTKEAKKLEKLQRQNEKEKNKLEKRKIKAEKKKKRALTPEQKLGRKRTMIKGTLFILIVFGVLIILPVLSHIGII